MNQYICLKGISKIVLVLTDGASNGYISPEIPAADLKSMDINIISIGVGSQLNYTQLTEIASPGNVVLIDSYSNVLSLFDDIKQTSCNVPAKIPDVTQTISVPKNEIKYFAYKINRQNSKKVKVEIENIVGKVKLFTSLTDENPNDYEVANLDQDDDDNDDDDVDNNKKVKQIFSKLMKRSVNEFKNNMRIMQKIDSSSSILTLPDNSKTNTTFVYMGVKGIMDLNDFKIKIIESNGSSTLNKSTTWLSLLFFSIISMIANRF